MRHISPVISDLIWVLKIQSKDCAHQFLYYRKATRSLQLMHGTNFIRGKFKFLILQSLVLDNININVWIIRHLYLNSQVKVQNHNVINLNSTRSLQSCYSNRKVVVSSAFMRIITA